MTVFGAASVDRSRHEGAHFSIMKTLRSLSLALSLLAVFSSAGAQLGSWELLVQNAGIASMHTAITHYGEAILLDRTDGGPTMINVTTTCSSDDCYAHSVLFIPESLSLVPLTVVTNPWCSSGQFSANGTLIETGGADTGGTKIRYFDPCPPGATCNWVEDATRALHAPRWYATNQLLPDGRMIVIGGLNQPNLEFIPDLGEGLVQFSFLFANQDSQGDNLYPYVHLLPDGNLYIFCNRASILFNYLNNTVLKTFPDIPGEPRNYPAAGSSVLLPLSSYESFTGAEVLVCGGAQLGSFYNKSAMMPASDTCGRLQVTDPDPVWVMETMPSRRCMGDMILLPSQSVLIINGAQAGSQGFQNAFYPNLTPVLYQPYAPLGGRFTELNATTIPRVYHSTANLLPDGRVLIAGSNTNNVYQYITGSPTSGIFPTELRIEAFSPPYLDPSLSMLRPIFISVPTTLTYNTAFSIVVSLGVPVVSTIDLYLASAPFATHSFSQGQRLLDLGATDPVSIGNDEYEIASLSPLTANFAPPSYYMLFAVNQGIPSVAAWVQIGD